MSVAVCGCAWCVCVCICECLFVCIRPSAGLCSGCLCGLSVSVSLCVFFVVCGVGDVCGCVCVCVEKVTSMCLSVKILALEE